MHCPRVLDLLYVSIQHPARRHDGQRPRLPIKAGTGAGTLLCLPPRLDFGGRTGAVCDATCIFGPGGVGRAVREEGAEFGEDVPELVDGGELLDVGLKEGLCRGVVEGFDVDIDIAANVLEGVDEAMRRESAS